MKSYTLPLTGTHCASCKLLIEDILAEDSTLENPIVDIKKQTLTLSSNREDEAILIQELNTELEPHGYSIPTGKTPSPEKRGGVFWTALPIGLVFLTLFFLLQKSGILSLGIGGKITPVTSFLIGLVASVSSCLAMVGGLVLSLSAEVAQDDGKSRQSIFLFHIGRILGFALLGGILGLLGETIGVSFTFSSLLGILSSLIMIILGLNLAGILKKNTLTLPTGIFSFLRRMEHTRGAPLFLGVATFFLPCGFTQAMQVASLVSGSFLSGFLIMLSFAIGTFPVLGLLSYSSVSFARSKAAPLFFATAGVVVIGLGLFTFLSGLAGLGIIRPLFSI